MGDFLSGLWLQAFRPFYRSSFLIRFSLGTPELEALFDSFFQAVIGGRVVGASFGQISLRHKPSFKVVAVFVAFAVTKRF